MNLAFWITLGLFITATILFFIFYKLKLLLPKKIFAFLTCPLIAATSVSSLYLFLPDSLPVIFTTILSFLCCTVSIILFFFESDIKFRVIGRSAFLLSICIWFNLFRSTFYIYKVPVLLLIICLLIYIGIFVITCFLLGKQKLSRFFWAFISILICSMLHFSTVVTLFEGHTLYSIFLFAGATGIFALTIYYLSLYKKEPNNHTKLIEFCMMLGSLLFISAANFLMLM